MHIRLIIILFIFSAFGSFAQMKGVVLGSDGKKQEEIAGAKLYFLQAKSGAETCDEGSFELILPRQLPDTLVVSATGYITDTLIVHKEFRFSNVKIILYEDQILPELVVEYRRNTKSFSKVSTLAVEQISLGELRKAACCNLSESFETNVSVDVNFTDAISGAKTIQMMGLEGVYTQIQMENIPYLRGLEQA